MAPPFDPGATSSAPVLADDRPLRLTTTEVCRLARLSRATLWRRIAEGRLPRPVDHGRQALFCAQAVRQALMRPPAAISPDDEIHAARFDRLVGRRHRVVTQFDFRG